MGGENIPYNRDDNHAAQKQEERLSDLLSDKQKLKDTHVRRTFLVENDLLDKLDEITDKTQNKSFKTEFINYVIRQGLDELSRSEALWK